MQIQRFIGQTKQMFPYNFALYDIIGTIIVSYVISRYFKYNFILSLFILFLLGTFLHIIFCVDTAFLRLF